VAVSLKYKGKDYIPESVYCGQNCTFVIAHLKQNEIKPTGEELEILKQLKIELLRKGTLAYFFGILDERYCPIIS